MMPEKEIIYLSAKIANTLGNLAGNTVGSRIIRKL
jgi:hypothetical protein